MILLVVDTVINDSGIYYFVARSSMSEVNVVLYKIIPITFLKIAALDLNL